MKRRRTTPPPILWGFWALLLILVTSARWFDLAGDRGFHNLITGVALILGFGAGLVWLVFRSGHPPRIRWGSLAAVLGLAVAFGLLFEVRGVRSEMIPILAFRFGPDRGPLPTAAGGVARVDLTETSPVDFPGFLGPGRDLRIESVELAEDWVGRPPELLWRQPIGAGWSGFAVVNGWAATLEQRDDRELVTLYDAHTGDLAWSRQLDSGRFDHPMGGVGPRSTPTIAGGVVFAMSVRGKLYALDGATGEPLWRRDLLADYGISAQEETGTVGYGRPTSPLVVEDKVIVSVGGPDGEAISVAAFDRTTGETIWEGGEWPMSMASPQVGELLGVRQVLMVNQNWVSGHDLATGQVLWEFPWPGITAGDASASQAVPVPPDRVFVSKGYGQGAALYELSLEADGSFAMEEIWHHPRVLRTKLTNVAIRDGYVYGLSEGILECVDLASGERMWKGGRYHHGQILMVGDVLLVLTEDGEMVMVEATPERANQVLGRFQALEGHTWNNFALYGDLLLVRNARQAAAWRLPLAGVLP